MYYVRVSFYENSSKSYVYAVPDYIDVTDIDKYVIVEDSLYRSHPKYPPYKIAFVVDVFYSKTKIQYVTKYIAGIIDGKSYKAARDQLDEEVENNRILNDQIESILKEFDYEDRKGVYNLLCAMAITAYV